MLEIRGLFRVSTADPRLYAHLGKLAVGLMRIVESELKSPLPYHRLVLSLTIPISGFLFLTKKPCGCKRVMWKVTDGKNIKKEEWEG